MEPKRRWQGRRYSDDKRQQMNRMLLEVDDYTVIADALDSIYRVFGTQCTWAPTKQRSALRLALAEREKISRGPNAGALFPAIATALQRAPATIARGVLASGGRFAYRAWRSDGSDPLLVDTSSLG